MERIVEIRCNGKIHYTRPYTVEYVGIIGDALKAPAYSVHFADTGEEVFELPNDAAKRVEGERVERPDRQDNWMQSATPERLRDYLMQWLKALAIEYRPPLGTMLVRDSAVVASVVEAYEALVDAEKRDAQRSGDDVLGPIAVPEDHVVVPVAWLKNPEEYAAELNYLIDTHPEKTKDEI